MTTAISLLQTFRDDQFRRGLLPLTIKKRSYDTRHWLDWCEAHEVAPLDATWREVQAWIDTKRNLSAKYRFSLLSSVTAFYESLIRAEMLTVNPVNKVPRPKLRPGLPRPISDDDLAVALKWATPQMRCWLSLMAYGGLRCAEVAGLERDDIIEAQGLMRVVGKGQKERVVPIHPKILEALNAYHMPRSGALWVRKRGGRYTGESLSQTVNQYLDDCGIDASAHQLRHWFGTRACEVGGIRTAQELLGHASPTSTAIYTKVSVEATRSTVAAIPTV